MKTIHDYISSYVNSLDPWQEYSKLNPLKKLLFKLLKVVRLERVHVVTPSGVEGVSEVYLAKCSVCGKLYIDYPHGYTRFIQCPYCKAITYL